MDSREKEEFDPEFSDDLDKDQKLSPLKFYRGPDDLVEQAEDEFDCDIDIEELRRELQEKRRQEQENQISKLDNSVKHTQASDRLNNRSSNTNKELEMQLLESWNVSGNCRKKAKFVGKEIQYQFKFYNPLKKQDEGPKAIDLRAKRLKTYQSMENSLQIPQFKDYSLLERVEIAKRFENCGVMKLETQMSLRQNDSRRM